MRKQNAKNAVARKFVGSRRLRGWKNTHFGGIDAVKMHPFGFCRFRPNEGGTVNTKLEVQLAPVSGYMRSKAYVDVVQIFVPYQAIEKLDLPDQEDAGVTEMTKRRLMANQGVGLETEGVISKAGNVHPRRDGPRKVSKSVRLAYIAAVNHMRLHAYFAATLAPHTETAILPAVLTANVLQRFNGVLDPERNIDGAINLTGELPVKGIGFSGDQADYRQNDNRLRETGGVLGSGGNTSPHAGANNPAVKVDPDNPNHPLITVDLDGTSEITLRDMVQSKKLDGIIRQFAGMIDEDPINGEEAVERALYSLSVDFDANCQVLYRKVHELTANHKRPSDGASFNDVSAHMGMRDEMTVIVPRSELGGQLVTLCSVKPLETLAMQPDPAQTETWELVNVVHDNLQLEEVLLTRGDLESDVTNPERDQPVFWVGHNSHKHNYVTHGPNLQQVQGVEMKSSMWTFEVPTSVTPENVSYPETGVDMYPFYNWAGAHAEYTFSQVAAISTSLALGPNPVEKIQLFADDPELIRESV